jgi:NADP-dependent 3-hydroxy acid dehydrogenase YdfG
MTDEKVWLVTGAGRGMGVDMANAALDTGYAVVATGRNLDTVKQAVGDHGDLLVVALDVTSPESANAAALEPASMTWAELSIDDYAERTAAVEQKAHDLLAQVAAYRDLSTSLAVDAAVTGS